MAKEPDWLSISAAADFLGVHFTTLRRWSDQGLVEFVRTPGGKRKYQRRALLEFLERHRTPAHAALALTTLRDEAVLKTRESFRSLGLSQQNWYGHLSEEQRLRMRGTGNRLIALMVQYGAHADNHQVFLDEAKRITQDYGRVCYQAGLTITECIQTFLLFRRPMLNAIQETANLQGMGDHESQRLFEKLHLFLDETLVTMVEEYDRCQAQDHHPHP